VAEPGLVNEAVEASSGGLEQCKLTGVDGEVVANPGTLGFGVLAAFFAFAVGVVADRDVFDSDRLRPGVEGGEYDVIVVVFLARVAELGRGELGEWGNALIGWLEAVTGDDGAGRVAAGDGRVVWHVVALAREPDGLTHPEVVAAHPRAFEPISP